MNYYAIGVGTLIIILFSWFFSIKYKRYHGITRFFAFESIYILILFNYRVCLLNPFSLHQILSWIFLTFSAYAGIAGYLLLKRHGKADRNFENTRVLVKSGLYGYIRHPLYFSVFLLGTGVMFKDPDKIQLFLGLINLVAIFFTARIEEKEMIAKFGDEYRTYMKVTKMFIPYLV
jgi:protein-S-isoprenylcysteine O-methyltransferase Ste14